MNSNGITYMKIFAGAGGLVEGFLREGYMPVAHVETDKYASLTLQAHPIFHFLKQKGNMETYNSYITRKMSRDELPEHLKTHRDRKLLLFKYRFKVVASNLWCSQTAVGHIAEIGHYFIHPDINQLRSVLVREAARLKSFFDNLYFEGPMTAMVGQTGNAVPLLIAKKVAKKIKEMMG